MKIIFLHIPKTAGQSVHSALVASFGDKAVCPARVNEQLSAMSIADLNRYSVFSGHFDWSMLDCIRGPVYTFTVLRQPVDRILSFYFYLRQTGLALSEEQRNLPENQGLKAAAEASLETYFCNGPAHLRSFIDDHYDNFYTYYFAGRKYSARSDFVSLLQRGSIDKFRIKRMALDNMSYIDDVFDVGDMSAVFAKIGLLSGIEPGSAKSYRVNVNDSVESKHRMNRLHELGATKAVAEVIESFCEMDNEIFNTFVAPTAAIT